MVVFSIGVKTFFILYFETTIRCCIFALQFLPNHLNHFMRLLSIKFCLFFVLFLLHSAASIAQTPTWSADVASIIYNNCSSCHRDGGIANFSLMGYAQTVAVADHILQEVEANRMPPYPPDVSYQQYAHERNLSQEEKNAISAWIQGGTPLGNPAEAPSPPVFIDGTQLSTTPNATYQIPTYTSTATTSDVYQCFVLPSGLWTQHHITALEVVPGNRSIVHHVLVFQDSTGSCRALDNATPEIGYANFGGVGGNGAKLVGSWVPGAMPYVLPTGMSVPLAANADFVLQIHYPAGTAGLQDSTKINVFWADDDTPNRTVNIERVLSHNNATLQNGPLYIPANTVRTFVERFTLPDGFDVSLLAVNPHMHLIGRKIKVFALSPGNPDTIPLINIPDWDFHWQGSYFFKHPIKLVGGSTLYAVAEYDNTLDNPNNPNFPLKDILAGESTTNEMMLVYFFFTTYQTGDEMIDLEQSDLISSAPYQLPNSPFLHYPSPANEQIQLVCRNCPTDTIPNMRLYNLNGQLVWYRQNVVLPFNIPCQNLPAGMYFLQMSNNKRSYTHKVLVQHYGN